MRVLVTGAGGFVGRHLCAHLLHGAGVEVLGVVHPQQTSPGSEEPRLRHMRCDLCDSASTHDLIGEAQPDLVFHLAAQASVPASLADPWATLSNNIRAQLNLLEALRQCSSKARVLVVGSPEEYGAPAGGELPLTEDSPLRPSNPYAVSKVTQDFMGLQYYLAYGLPVIRVRPFNHTGPGQSDRFVVPAFARQIARIEAGLQEPTIRVGNLDARRDFSDVRDVVRGYRLLLSSGVPGEVYNLASGRSRSIRRILESLISLSAAEVQVAVDPRKFRPVDVPDVFGSAEKMHQATGWVPEIPFTQTLRDTLQYWRKGVGSCPNVL